MQEEQSGMMALGALVGVIVLIITAIMAMLVL